MRLMKSNMSSFFICFCQTLFYPCISVINVKMTFEFHKNEEGKASFALKQNFWVNVRKPCFFCFLSMKKKVIKKAEQKKVNKWRLNSMEYSRPPHLLSRLLKSRRLIYMTRLDILLIIDNNLHRCLLYTYSIDIWPARNSRLAQLKRITILLGA